MMSHRSVPLYSALPFTARVSPPHRRFTSLSFGSIFESQVRSSQVPPFRRTTASLGILKDGGGGSALVTQRLRCVFFSLNYEAFMITIWSGVSLAARLLFLHVLRYSVRHSRIRLFGELAGEQSVLCDAPLIPITAFESSKKMTQIHIWHGNNKTT